MIQSMTAFARLSDQHPWGMITWEIRVVNHRYLDCSLKIPEAFRSHETTVRLQLQQQLHRGRVECALRFNRESQGEQHLVLNTALIKKLSVALDEVKTYLPTTAVIDPIKILSWPQVLQNPDEDLSVAQTAVLQLFEKTLEELVATRRREGAVLAKLTQEKLQEMLVLITKVKSKIPQVLLEQRSKILKRLEEIMANLDQARFEQEMVYFAQKIDVTEEIERLEAHTKEVLRILDSGGFAGKRLDFLMQELNREANTLGSKSVAIETTQTAIELKVLIEQMREQVQNIV